MWIIVYQKRFFKPLNVEIFRPSKTDFSLSIPCNTHKDFRKNAAIISGRIQSQIFFANGV